MCGIAGWIRNTSDSVAMNCLMEASSRGCDGFGILNTDSLELFKKAKRFDADDYISDLNKNSILAHFRLHTIINTSKNEEYIQPLKYKNYYISHNGYLKNVDTKESDSLFLLKTIVNTMDPAVDIHQVVKNLKIKQIAIGVYDYTRKIFYLYRKNMPLYLSEKNNAFCSKQVDKTFKLIQNEKQVRIANG